MTTPHPPDPHVPDPTDALLRDAYTDLVDDLSGTLDLTAGVEEATEPRSYQALTDDLAYGLDLERGLTAITDGPTPTPAQSAPAHDLTAATGDLPPLRAWSARARRRDRERADAELIHDLRWQWRTACAATPLSQMIYTPSGATRAVPTIAHVDLGPPVTFTVQVRPGQSLADFIAAAPLIAQALGVAALDVVPLAPQWVRIVLVQPASSAAQPQDVPSKPNSVEEPKRRNRTWGIAEPHGERGHTW